MKKLFLPVLLLLLIQFSSFSQEQAAYFEVGKSNEELSLVIGKVKNSLENAGFRIIGEYIPKNNENMAVVCYTSNELEKIALSFQDRGALAAALKVGFIKEGDQVKISMINPMYLFYAYFIDNIDEKEKTLLSISESAKNALKVTGNDFIPFGGTLDKKKLQNYHYKVMMPYFKDAEILKEFDSYEEGVQVIQQNLENGKADCEIVYTLLYPENEVAVFGVGLKNTDNGEAKFLPIIGEDHIAAMPYEIILQGKTASILPGKYRIALHWPELTMGTFMKIMSTPGDIKDALQELTN